MAEHFNDSYYLTTVSDNADEKNLEQQNRASAADDSTTTTTAKPNAETNAENDASAKQKKDVIIVDCYDTAETIPYKPLEYHWFYTDKSNWLPMSNKDSKKLDKIYTDNL